MRGDKPRGRGLWVRAAIHQPRSRVWLPCRTPNGPPLVGYSRVRRQLIPTRGCQDTHRFIGQASSAVTTQDTRSVQPPPSRTQTWPAADKCCNGLVASALSSGFPASLRRRNRASGGAPPKRWGRPSAGLHPRARQDDNGLFPFTERVGDSGRVDSRAERHRDRQDTRIQDHPTRLWPDRCRQCWIGLGE